MNNIWNTSRNRYMQVSDLQGNVCLLGNTCVPAVVVLGANGMQETSAKDFIAHGYGGSDG